MTGETTRVIVSPVLNQSETFPRFRNEDRDSATRGYGIIKAI